MKRMPELFNWFWENLAINFAESALYLPELTLGIVEASIWSIVFQEIRWPLILEDAKTSVNLLIGNKERDTEKFKLM